MPDDRLPDAARYGWRIIDSDGDITELRDVPEPTWDNAGWVTFFDPTTPGEYEENACALFFKPRSVIRKVQARG